MADKNPGVPNPGRMALLLIPTTPVSFSGPDAGMAWLRILAYGATATLVWKGNRTIGYVAAGAAALALITSLSADAVKATEPVATTKLDMPGATVYAGKPAELKPEASLNG